MLPASYTRLNLRRPVSHSWRGGQEEITKLIQSRVAEFSFPLHAPPHPPYTPASDSHSPSIISKKPHDDFWRETTKKTGCGCECSVTGFCADLLAGNGGLGCFSLQTGNVPCSSAQQRGQRRNRSANKCATTYSPILDSYPQGDHQVRSSLRSQLQATKYFPYGYFR